MHIEDHVEDLVRYRDWAPTMLDTKGLNLPDKQDWYVSPCLQTRDSECLEQSNFATALECLEEIDSRCESHSFGHWGPGWIEVVLCPPTKAIGMELARIVCALSDYPVLSDDDLSERECVEAQEAWVNYACSEFIDTLCDKLDIGEFGKDILQSMDVWVLMAFNCAYTDCDYESTGEGASYDFSHVEQGKITRANVCKIIRKYRRGEYESE